jgi:hypothetical protein
VTVFWDVSLCSMVDIYRRFKDAFFFHHEGDDFYLTTRRSSNFHTCRYENLKSHQVRKTVCNPSSSLAYSSYSLTIASFKMIAYSSRSSALFLHLLTSNVFSHPPHNPATLTLVFGFPSSSCVSQKHSLHHSFIINSHNLTSPFQSSYFCDP